MNNVSTYIDTYSRGEHVPFQSGELERELGDWQVVVGVREVAEIPTLLKAIAAAER